MMLLLVTFSLRNPAKDYDSFFVALRGNSLQWLHYIEGTYVITTNYNPTELVSRLAPHIEATDSILIVPVTAPINGWLPPDAWDWITSQMGALNPNRLLPE